MQPHVKSLTREQAYWLGGSGYQRVAVPGGGEWRGALQAFYPYRAIA
jgi:hypothetical protein